MGGFGPPFFMKKVLIMRLIRLIIKSNPTQRSERDGMDAKRGEAGLFYRA